jgi:hypothetical protein
MGLISWWRIRRMTDPVAGSLKITACPQPDTALSGSYSALVLGVVQAPGVSPQAVEVSTSVPSKRCPVSGQRVPVIVDRDDPSKVVIRWRNVPLRNTLGPARRYAAASAASARRRASR